MNNAKRFAFIWISTVFAMFLANSGQNSFAEASKPSFEKIEIDGCHNVYALDEKVLSGSQPEGEVAFEALSKEGVKSIVSVDGAKPDIDGAAKYGLQYVHIPFGYDGVPKEQAATLSKALETLPGKIYVHCHHGKHRSPAGSAMAFVCLGKWTNDEATAFMKAAGTAPSYIGLYGDVGAAKPLDKEILAAMSANFPQIAKLPSDVDMMVALEEHFDRLVLCEAEGWVQPKSNPDVNPKHESLQFMEVLVESNRTGMFATQSADFKKWMVDLEAIGKDILAALEKGDSATASARLKAAKASCTSCHEVYRNVPKK